MNVATQKLMDVLTGISTDADTIQKDQADIAANGMSSADLATVTAQMTEIATKIHTIALSVSTATATTGTTTDTSGETPIPGA